MALIVLVQRETPIGRRQENVLHDLHVMVPVAAVAEEDGVAVERPDGLGGDVAHGGVLLLAGGLLQNLQLLAFGWLIRCQLRDGDESDVDIRVVHHVAKQFDGRGVFQAEGLQGAAADERIR